MADLVIKVYAGGVVDRFPDGGKMSQYFGSLKVGDEVALQGPIGTIERFTAREVSRVLDADAPLDARRGMTC